MKMTDNLAGLAAAITKHLLERQEEFMRAMPGFNSYVFLDRQDLVRVVTEALENF